MASPRTGRGWYGRWGKRALDIGMTLVALPVALPAAIVIYIVVGCHFGENPIFTQLRIGRGGKLFRLYKFRSMRSATDAEGQPLPDAERLTHFGIWLRSTSLDELPQLFQILAGQMSWVGPRPLLPEYLPLYNARQAIRHSIRPGLTGLAQVRGRNASTWPERLSADVEYVEGLSLGADIGILMRSITYVVAKRGIQAVGEATMPKFRGDEPLPDLLFEHS